MEWIIIGWLYAWGAVFIGLSLAYFNINEDEDGDPHFAGAAILGLLWPITVPIMTVRQFVRGFIKGIVTTKS